MKRSHWLPLFGATLLAGIGLSVSELRAQDYSRYPVLAREASVREQPAREQIPVIPVGDPIVNVLPSQIKNLPDVNGSLKVVHRRSQLIIAKGNVVRTAIADPSIVDVVQYTPNEIAVIGMSLGSTTVTLWFDDGSEPLIYLVETVRDPSLEDRKKVDYGKLEKKLAVLFPNSKVYLIPMSWKII
ncbi:MAG: pilus assembly protein N-terminal domain-containing protein, partial [Planctomycetota bacterium]